MSSSSVMSTGRLCKLADDFSAIFTADPYKHTGSNNVTSHTPRLLLLTDDYIVNFMQLRRRRNQAEHMACLASAAEAAILFTVVKATTVAAEGAVGETAGHWLVPRACWRQR